MAVTSVAHGYRPAGAGQGRGHPRPPRGGECTGIAEGESVIKYKSPLNVLKDTYDYSCCLARSYEYNHLMTDPPGAALAASRPFCYGNPY
jgi:hypothetical protein